jgi:predicted transcriptional regulator
MTGSTSRKRRARHDIVMEVLKAAENGVKKTKIMYKASLSFDQLKQYLNALKKENFITEESGIWKTTEKGLHVIEACKICQRLLEEVP